MVKPIQKFQAGNIDAAIWQNEVEMNGKKVSTKSVSLRKSWKNGNEWKDSVLHLKPTEIHKAIVVLQEVQRELVIHNGNEKAVEIDDGTYQ